jgi:threonine dehydrogenase-like Zn-dependent dehydrogenase
MKTVTLRGVRGVDQKSFQQAVRLIEADRLPLDRLHTHHVPLDAADRAVRLLSEPGGGAVAVTVEP